MPTLPHTPAAIARRLLLAAWAIDDDHGLTPAERTWLGQRLADQDWLPTVQECAAFRLPLLTWARRYGETALVIRALVPSFTLQRGGEWSPRRTGRTPRYDTGQAACLAQDTQEPTMQQHAT